MQPARHPSATPSARWVALGIALLAGVAFLPALRCGFVHIDDPQVLPEYATILRGITWDGLRFAVERPYFGHWAPATVLSLMLDWQLWGPSAAGHHLTSLLLHAANAALVFLLWQRLGGRIGRAAAVAALFAVHPLRVEPVLWISGRKDLLSAFFALLALLLYARWCEAPSRRRYAGVAAAMALALLSKATALVLPGLMLLLDFWPLRRLTIASPAAAAGGSPAARSARALVVEKLPLLALSALAAFAALASASRAMTGLATRAPAERLANAVVGFDRYLGKVFWPVDLSAFYPLPLQPWSWAVVAAAAARFLAFSVVAASQRRRWPWLTVGWCWWVLCLLPVSGLLQAGDQAMADRYTYLAAVGLSVAVVWIVAELLRGRRRALLGAAAAASALVVAAAIATRAEIRWWRDSETLFRRMLAVTENNHFGELNLGGTLAGQGKAREAIPHYRRAIELRPDIAIARSNLGSALRVEGDLAGAERELLTAIRMDPELAGAHFNLAMVYEEEGRLGPAAGHLVRVVSLDPSFRPAWQGLADLLTRPGGAAEALPYIEALAATARDSPELQRLLAAVRARAGEGR